MQFAFRVMMALAVTSTTNATTAGARFFYNPIRKGSIASDEQVYDAMLGKPLRRMSGDPK